MAWQSLVWINFEKTELYYAYDENDLAVNGLPNYKFGVQQNFSFPLLYTSQRKLNKATYEKQKKFYELRQVQIDQMLQTAYYNLLFEMNRLLYAVWLMKDIRFILYFKV